MKELIKEFKQKIDLEINKLDLLLNKINNDFCKEGIEILEKISELKTLKDKL